MSDIKDKILKIQKRISLIESKIEKENNDTSSILNHLKNLNNKLGYGINSLIENIDTIITTIFGSKENYKSFANSKLINNSDFRTAVEYSFNNPSDSKIDFDWIINFIIPHVKTATQKSSINIEQLQSILIQMKSKIKPTIIKFNINKVVAIMNKRVNESKKWIAFSVISFIIFVFFFIRQMIIYLTENNNLDRLKRNFESIKDVPNLEFPEWVPGKEILNFLAKLYIMVGRLIKALFINISEVLIHSLFMNPYLLAILVVSIYGYTKASSLLNL